MSSLKYFLSDSEQGTDLSLCVCVCVSTVENGDMQALLGEKLEEKEGVQYQ